MVFLTLWKALFGKSVIALHLPPAWLGGAVALGAALIVLGERFWPQVPLGWVDPVAAIFVALLILKTAWNLTIQSGRDLLDTSQPPEEQAWLHSYLDARLGKLIRGYHRMRTRKAGSTCFIDLHLQVDPKMTVAESHNIAHQVADGIKARYAGASVTVHIEPDDGTRNAEQG